MGTDTEARINWKRQRDIFDPEEYRSSEVTIVGLGNIGSQVALALARLGIHNFTLYDFDTVEHHNLSSQSFRMEHIGVSKVEATKQVILETNPEAMVRIINKKYEPSSVSDNEVLIIAVDSMKSRKKIHSYLSKKAMGNPKVIIDGRIGGPQLEIWTFQGENMGRDWHETLFDGASQDPCGARYICYVSMVIGALIANQVKRILKDEPIKKSILFDINSLQIL